MKKEKIFQEEKKVMKKKIIAAFLTTAMTIGSLSGVTVFAADAGTDEKVEMADASDVDGTTITFWHSMGGVNGEAIDTLVKKFNDENEYGITVDAQYQGEYDDSLNKLKSAQIGNMGADLVQVYEIGTRFMIDSGWIVPMQQMIDADSYDVSEIEPNLAAYYTIDNELYSMPFNSSTPIMYYNKDMFDKAGITEVPDSLDGSSSSLSESRALSMQTTETDVKRLLQLLLLTRMMLQRISLQHGRILTTRASHRS